MRKTALLLICLSLAGAPAALADRNDETSPEAIRVELERLSIIYTEDHPDIQILKRRLDLAEQQKKKRDEEKARRRQIKERQRLQGPAAAPPSAGAPAPEQP